MALSNPKHEIFAVQAAKGNGGPDGYAKAGYKARGNSASANASRLLRTDKIQKRIAEIRSQEQEIERKSIQIAAENVAVDRTWILARLKMNAERAMQLVEVTDAKGKRLGIFKYEGAVANRALELLGRAMGMFADWDDRPSDGDENLQFTVNISQTNVHIHAPVDVSQANGSHVLANGHGGEAGPLLVDRGLEQIREDG